MLLDHLKSTRLSKEKKTLLVGHGYTTRGVLINNVNTFNYNNKEELVTLENTQCEPVFVDLSGDFFQRWNYEEEMRF
jgi:hypothetical protein